MSAEIDAINHVVIGMGINHMNIAECEFPYELQPIATSLSMISGGEISRLTLLNEILAELEVVYSQVVENGFVKMLDEWRELSITLGQQVDVVGSGRSEWHCY